MAPAFRGPILLGQPSPSLHGMRRMGRAELVEHVQRLLAPISHRGFEKGRPLWLNCWWKPPLSTGKEADL